MIRPWSSLSLTLVAVGVAGCGCTKGDPAAARDGANAAVERLVVAMGTSLGLEITAPDRATALRASEAAVQAVEAVEQRLSSWRSDSELSQFLATPVGEPFAASEALCEDLQRVLGWSDATDGAIDPTVGALVELYDLRGDGRWPDDEELVGALARAGHDHLRLQAKELRRTADLRLDAGAFGKGAALDAAARAAIDAGATSAWFDFGGQLLGAGSPAPHAVEIADPRDRSRPALRLRIAGGSVATTGNSERRRIVDARPLAHVLDPRTGKPAADFGSVTILADSAFDADCLSTACFVLGPHEALAFAERIDGVEAVVLLASEEPRSLTVRVSSGLRDRVMPLMPDLTIR